MTVLATLIFSTQIYASNLTNFNEPNTQNLINAMGDQSLNVIQFGDSHTAADVMTETLRDRLQSSLGNGGMGWGMPMYFTGQRLAEYGYDNNGWTPISSRTNKNENYTVGGLLAIPDYSGATLTIKPKQNEQEQQIKVSIRQANGDGRFSGVDSMGRQFNIEAPVKNNTWQLVSFKAKLPFTITANQTQNSAIGGWWAKNASGKGAVVSALGINGAQLNSWDYWNNAWKTELGQIAPNLVILAYGTNEAYNNVNIQNAQQSLVSTIQDIRAASPNTAIMIVSAPESLRQTAGQCGQRPESLTEFQQMQVNVAQAQHTLFWDWQQAMGGECSMKQWISRGDGRTDGVHFTTSGYQKLGAMLANDLLNLSQRSNLSNSSVTQNQPAMNINHQYINSNQSNSNSTQNNINNPSVTGQICDADKKNCKSFNFS